MQLVCVTSVFFFVKIVNGSTVLRLIETSTYFVLSYFAKSTFKSNIRIQNYTYYIRSKFLARHFFTYMELGECIEASKLQLNAAAVQQN